MCNHFRKIRTFAPDFSSSLCDAGEYQAELAQLVEQRIRNAWVGGSSPPFGSKRQICGVQCTVCGFF